VARDDCRIFGAQRIWSSRLKLDADNADEESSAFPSMNTVWHVEDNSATGCGFAKYESELLQWRSEREPALSQPFPVFQDVDRIHESAMIRQRGELGIKGWASEDVFAVFCCLDWVGVCPMSIFCWQIGALKNLGFYRCNRVPYPLLVARRQAQQFDHGRCPLAVLHGSVFIEGH